MRKNIVFYILITTFMQVSVTVPAYCQMVKLDKVVDSGDPKYMGKIESPVFHPNNPDLVAFTINRSADLKKLFIFEIDTAEVYEVKSDPTSSDEAVSWISSAGYDDQLDWRPVNSPDSKKWFVFVGAGNSLNIDIYLAYPGLDVPIRLTIDESIDFSPKWHPAGDKIAFVSSRTGRGDIYILENIDDVIKSGNSKTVKLRRISFNEQQDRDPEWHPAGDILVFSEFKREESTEQDNFGIAMFDFKDENYFFKNGPKRLTITRQAQHETNPSFSPNGSKLSYYITDEYHEDAIEPVNALGRKVNIEWGTFGPDESNSFDQPEFKVISGRHEFFAVDVVPDSKGPVWGANSDTIVFTRYDVSTYFPLVAANTTDWEAKRSRNEYMMTIDTKTRQNSSISMLIRNGEYPLATFVALDGIRYTLYKMTIRGRYFSVSESDIPDQGWYNRSTQPYTTTAWYMQKKFQIPIASALGGLVYLATSKPPESKKTYSLEKLGNPPSLP